MSDWVGKPIAPSRLQARVRDDPAIRAYEPVGSVNGACRFFSHAVQ